MAERPLGRTYMAPGAPLQGGWRRWPVALESKSDEKARRRDAVAELYETHFGRVARYAYVRIGNMAEAEDLASEVFVRALRSVDNWKDTGAPMEAWIFRIAHNLVVDLLRRRSRRPAATPLEDVPPDHAENPDMDSHMEHQREMAELQKAMQQLSQGQREVLALRFSDAEMTSEQVAEVLGKKPGAIREMQSAAIKKLRSILAAEGRQV